MNWDEFDYRVEQLKKGIVVAIVFFGALWLATIFFSEFKHIVYDQPRAIQALEKNFCLSNGYEDIGRESFLWNTYAVCTRVNSNSALETRKILYWNERWIWAYD